MVDNETLEEQAMEYVSKEEVSEAVKIKQMELELQREIEEKKNIIEREKQEKEIQIEREKLAIERERLEIKWEEWRPLKSLSEFENYSNYKFLQGTNLNVTQTIEFDLDQLENIAGKGSKTGSPDHGLNSLSLNQARTLWLVWESLRVKTGSDSVQGQRPGWQCEARDEASRSEIDQAISR